MEKEEIVDKVKHEIIILSDLKEIDKYEIQEYPDMNPSKNDYYFKGSDEEKKKLDEEEKKEAIEKKKKLKNKSLDLHYKIDNTKKKELETNFAQIKLKINLSGKPQILSQGKIATLSKESCIIYDSAFFKKLNEIKFEKDVEPIFAIELDNGDLVFACKKDDPIYNYDLLIYRLKDQNYFLIQKIKEGGLGFPAKYYITGHCSYSRQYHKLNYEISNLKKISGNRFICLSDYGIKMYSLNEKNEYSLVLLNEELQDIKMIEEINENKFLFGIQEVRNDYFSKSIVMFVGMFELKNATKEELDKKLSILKEKGYQSGKKGGYCHKYNMFGFPIFRGREEEEENEENNKDLYDDEIKKIIESLKFSCSILKGVNRYNSYDMIQLSGNVILKKKYYIMILGNNFFVYDLQKGKELKRYEILIDGIFNEKDSLFIPERLDIKKWNNDEDNEFILILGKNVILFELVEGQNDSIKLNILNNSYFPNIMKRRRLQNLSDKNNKFCYLGEESHSFFEEESNCIILY